MRLFMVVAALQPYNKVVIDFNQDPLGVAAAAFQPPGVLEIQQGENYPYWVDAGPGRQGVQLATTQSKSILAMLIQPLVMIFRQQAL